VVKAEKVVDYSPKENLFEHLSERFGTRFGAALGRAALESAGSAASGVR
jgi:hypothetical protein